MTRIQLARARYHYARQWLAACNAKQLPRGPALAECKAARAHLARTVQDAHLALLKRERDRLKSSTGVQPTVEDVSEYPPFERMEPLHR